MTVNKNNHPDTALRKAKRTNQALLFARGLKDTFRGIQAMQAQKKRIILSMMAQYGLKVREARLIFKQA